MKALDILCLCGVCGSSRVQNRPQRGVIDDAGGYSWCDRCSREGDDAERKYLLVIGHRTIAEWLEQAHASCEEIKGCIYILDSTVPYELRAELWNLSDFYVSSLSGGMLCLRPTSQQGSRP